MAIMEVLVRSVYEGQQCINRWNYIVTGTPAAVTRSFALAHAFGLETSGGIFDPATVLYAVQQLVSTSVLFEEIQVKDVYSETDFYTSPYPTDVLGLESGTPSSPVLAFGFKSNRIRTNVRSGTKRFPGVSEGAIGGAGALESAALSAAEDIATAMSQVLEYDDEGNILSFTPAVCSRLMYTTPPAKRAYRYYDTEEEQLDHTAIGVVWSPYDFVRSQVSRQYGHGA